MVKKKPLKEPSDYPVLRVRVPTAKHLGEINEEVERVRDQLVRNEVPSPFEKVWMKNHVILEAIQIGLKELKKRKR